MRSARSAFDMACRRLGRRGVTELIGQGFEASPLSACSLWESNSQHKIEILYQVTGDTVDWTLFQYLYLKIFQIFQIVLSSPPSSGFLPAYFCSLFWTHDKQN